MIDLWLVVRIRYECRCYKPMHSHVFPFPIFKQIHTQIALVIVWLQIRVSLPVVNSAPGSNFVGIKTYDRSLDFQCYFLTSFLYWKLVTLLLDLRIL